MSHLVLDASAAVRLAADVDPVAPALAEAVHDADTVFVPAIYGFEVANALWKYVRHGDFGQAEAAAMLADARAYADEVVVDGVGFGASLSDEALSEACRLGHPVYDLVYVVLARRLAAPLATCDRCLADLATSLGVTVVGC